LRKNRKNKGKRIIQEKRNKKAKKEKTQLNIRRTKKEGSKE
jgi:hypothetical protein